MQTCLDKEREIEALGFAQIDCAGVPLWVLRSWQQAGIFHGFLGADIDLALGAKQWEQCFPGNRLALLNQVHGTEVVSITKPGASNQRYFEGVEQKENRAVADGWLIGREVGEDLNQALSARGVFGVLTADCTPVLVAAPKTRLVAALHCGWRSAVGGILPVAISKMKALGAIAEEIEVAIGPGAQVDCYQVGAEVADRFTEATCGFEKKLAAIAENSVGPVVVVDSAGSLHCDIGGLLEQQCLVEGLLPGHISRLPICTISNKNFFSHRRQKALSGRQVSFISALS